MLDVQAHRGPDGEGLWFQHIGSVAVGLGHRRLSIIDLSAGGNQPRISRCGRYVLTYNGELYNYLELRNELKRLGCDFETESDTEVVLQAFVTWGTQAFERFNGMWALAILDILEHVLTLSRDRFGEKPLYIYPTAEEFYFSSEVKAIFAGTSRRFKIHLPAVWRFLEQSLLNAQNSSFFEDIIEVPAGHFVQLAVGSGELKLSAPSAYWSIESGLTLQDDAERLEVLRETFFDAVRLRLRSDVPVAILLSGGIDSSSIATAAYMLKPNSRIHMISAVSDDAAFSEEQHINVMAEHLRRRVEKVILRPDPKQSFSHIQNLVWHNDEPIGGFSSVAYYSMMQRAREIGAKVVLSGQGADELLCGYRKYTAFHLQSLYRERRAVALVREGICHLLPPWSFVRDFNWGEAQRYLPKSVRRKRHPILGPAFNGHSWELSIGLGPYDISQRQVLDLTRYSVPSLTHYEDRMSMAASREVRLPFLDHRLVKMLVTLPVEWKLNRGWSKWVFRWAMEPLLPKKIAWRKDKKPFITPIASWLRNDWRENIEDMLGSNMVSASLGLIDPENLRKRYRGYCTQPGSFWEFNDVFNPVSLEFWARQFQLHLN